MNYSQHFEEFGSCMSEHMNLAMLAEKRLAKGQASASNQVFT